MTEKTDDFVCAVRKIGCFFAGKGYWGKPKSIPRASRGWCVWCPSGGCRTFSTASKVEYLNSRYSTSDCRKSRAVRLGMHEGAAAPSSSIRSGGVYAARNGSVGTVSGIRRVVRAARGTPDVTRKNANLHFFEACRLCRHAQVEYLNSRYSTFQPVEKGHRKVAFFLIGDSRIEGKNAV